MNQKSSGGGLGILGVLFIVFLVLKLTGLIEWGWMVVFIPFWIWLTLLAVIIILAIIASR